MFTLAYHSRRRGNCASLIINPPLFFYQHQHPLDRLWPKNHRDSREAFTSKNKNTEKVVKRLGFFDPISKEERSEAIARVSLNGVAKSSKTDIKIVEKAAEQQGSVGNAAKKALGRA